jgi:hypothetical protein
MTSVMQNHLCFPLVKGPSDIPNVATWEGSGAAALRKLTKAVHKFKSLGLPFNARDMSFLAQYTSRIAPSRSHNRGLHVEGISTAKIASSSRLMARVISRLKGTISVHSGEGHTKDFAKPIEDRCLLSNVVGYFSRGGISGARLVREVGLKHPTLAYGFHWVHRIRTRAFYCYQDTVNLGLNVDLPVGHQCPLL